MYSCQSGPSKYHSPLWEGALDTHSWGGNLLQHVCRIICSLMSMRQSGQTQLSRISRNVSVAQPAFMSSKVKCAFFPFVACHLLAWVHIRHCALSRLPFCLNAACLEVDGMSFIRLKSETLVLMFCFGSLSITSFFSGAVFIHFEYADWQPYSALGGSQYLSPLIGCIPCQCIRIYCGNWTAHLFLCKQVKDFEPQIGRIVDW